MSIRTRIFGGFGLSLLMTLAVALVAWQSLTGFARRVDAANGAQILAGEIGELALAADRALKSDDGRHDAGLEALETEAGAGGGAGRGHEKLRLVWVVGGSGHSPAPPHVNPHAPRPEL